MPTNQLPEADDKQLYHARTGKFPAAMPGLPVPVCDPSDKKFDNIFFFHNFVIAKTLCKMTKKIFHITVMILMSTLSFMAQAQEETTSESKPVIKRIFNLERTDYDDFTFSLKFDVEYSGASCVKVEIEEEYSTTLRTTIYNEPDIVHVSTGRITGLAYSRVIVSCTNAYGTAEEVMEFAPAYPGFTNDAENAGPFDTTTIFGVDGIPLYEGALTEIDKGILPRGIYIRVDSDMRGRHKSSKFIVH
ncbi:MAG: hypothetical protein K2M19_05910 [Muribaculaceae bacterium]|nr:hypothetical protein [Muribaculaceae bacterium]